MTGCWRPTYNLKLPRSGLPASGGDISDKQLERMLESSVVDNLECSYRRLLIDYSISQNSNNLSDMMEVDDGIDDGLRLTSIVHDGLLWVHRACRHIARRPAHMLFSRHAAGVGT